MKTLFSLIILIFFLNCEKKINFRLENTTFKTGKNIEKPIQINQDYFFSFTILEKDEAGKPVKLRIDVKKNNKVVQEIMYIPEFWLNNDYNPINYYNTNLKFQEGIENFHNFIIADFNFDNLKDFAILYDSGGNGGPLYSYFFQNKKGEFNQIRNFPLNEGYFPKKINTKDSTIIISGPIGCCKIKTTVFQLKNNNWNLISSKEKMMKE